MDDFTFSSHLSFSTSDGQYAIVYVNESIDRTYGDTIYSIYVHFINDDQDQTSEEHLLFQGSSDNSVTAIQTIHRDVISTNFSFEHISSFPLLYGGFTSIDQIGLSSQVNVYNFNYTSSYKLFELLNETIVDYGIYSNNTLWLTYGNSTTAGYKNRAILSIYPTLNMTVPLSYIDHFNITFSVPIVTSSGNISIYQVVDQDKFLLRQTYPVSSCKTLLSTFNRVNNNYTIMANYNFVKTLSFNEPLKGIDQGIWNVKTPQTYNSAVSSNKTQLLNDILQQIKQSIPLNDDRLKITNNVQLDPLDSTKLSLNFLLIRQ
ncbi:13479_t:CDS:2 [Dentiscutata erythropus]|uniref:13479_t:CDS:1 n=1 Tax=Dentiscutata erythropus TaxID=1348616 RepID=A0A9N9A5Z5_9GLOM|nr:13479_t:CDS:2 [Dentiscutata erythropus]